MAVAYAHYCWLRAAIEPHINKRNVTTWMCNLEGGRLYIRVIFFLLLWVEWQLATNNKVHTAATCVFIALQKYPSQMAAK